MAEDLTDIKIFEIVYNKHPNEPMSFIQEEALKMQIAVHRNKVYMKQYMDENFAAQPVDGVSSVMSPIMPSGMPSIDNGVKTKSPALPIEKPDVSTWLINDPEEMKKSISEDRIKCCVCGKEMTMMSRHLDKHGLTADEYRRLIGVEPNTPLMAKGYYSSVVARMSKKKSNEQSEPQPTGDNGTIQMEPPMPDIHTM
ncbi:MAG: MucR family transcriptional regulator [Desulfovibrionaceae bacterium]|nr:MucR family transcriptional regulator [Desulfovibrionaceae bacterium]